MTKTKSLRRSLAGLAFPALAAAGLWTPSGAAVHDGAFSPKSYLVYYGAWDAPRIREARGFDLIVAHPGQDMKNLDRETVSKLKLGADGKAGTPDDAKVIAYISIGEAHDVPRGAARSGPGGEGPVRWEPGRGVVKGHDGYPSYYLDHRAFRFNESGFYDWNPDGSPGLKKGRDGIPDENGRWGSYFVNAGDPEWRRLVLARMRSMVERFGVDGFFLDTLDTASPWGDYSWTAEGMAGLVRLIGDEFPDSYILANRGLFLLESHPDVVRPAIDGIMFESFITEWDWYRKKGTLHRWLESNLRVLEKDVIPQAGKPDGFHIYMLNYLDPLQDDFHVLSADLDAALGGARWTSYISTPDLQKIFLPGSHRAEKKVSLPEIERFTVVNEGKGRYVAAIELRHSGPLKLGGDVFLDLRYDTRRLEAGELFLSPRLDVDYDMLIVDETPDGYRVSVEAFGLHTYRRHFFYLRLRGRRPDAAGPVVRATAVTAGGDHPDILPGLKAEGREKSVVLTWKSPQESVEAFDVHMGAHPARLSKLRRVSRPKAVVDDLRNGDVYYFSVSAVDKEGREGGLARPVAGVPRKTAPPAPPTRLSVEPAGKGAVVVRWRRSASSEVSGYRVYCFRSDRGLRLPLEVPRDKTSVVVKGLQAGREYSVLVTAADFDKIQSQPASAKIVVK